MVLWKKGITVLIFWVCTPCFPYFCVKLHVMYLGENLFKLIKTILRKSGFFQNYVIRPCKGCQIPVPLPRSATHIAACKAMSCKRIGLQCQNCKTFCSWLYWPLSVIHSCFSDAVKFGEKWGMGEVLLISLWAQERRKDIKNLFPYLSL